MENRKEGAAKIGDFTQLRVWQAARKLRQELYRLTRNFPEQEQFGLTTQTRRGAVSVTANLAEGYDRFSYQGNIQFCRQSRASLDELRDHLTSALDAGYVSRDKHRQLESQATDVLRLLNGYIRSTKKLKDNAPSR